MPSPHRVHFRTKRGTHWRNSPDLRAAGGKTLPPKRNATRLISVPGAIGHAVGFTPNSIAIKVYVEKMSDRARQAMPNQIEGVPVVLEAVGPIRAIGSMGACVKR